MSRTDGRKLVALAFTAMVGALGIGTIYLPYMADRDKLRGFFEEGDESVPEGVRREMQAIAKAETAVRQLQQQHEPQVNENEQNDRQKQNLKASAGSMWSSFRRNS